jgi:hypothetical protein
LIDIKRAALAESSRGSSSSSLGPALEEHLFGPQAGQHEDFFVAHFIWSHGFSIDAKLPSGKTAMERALESRNTRLIEELLNWGAKVPCKDAECAKLFPKHPLFGPIISKLSDRSRNPAPASLQTEKSQAFKTNLRKEIEFFDQQRTLNAKANFQVVGFEQQKSLVIEKPAVFVTHVSGSFKGSELIYPEVDAVLERLTRQGVKTVYLSVDTSTGEGLDLNWQTANKKPDALLHSTAGEHFAKVRSHDLHFVGGYQGACFGNTLSHTLNSFFDEYPKGSGQTLRMTLYPKAVYSSTSTTMCRWAEKKTFGVLNPTDELVRQLYQDLLNRNPDLGERATIEFFRDGVLIGKRGEGPQKIEFRLRENDNLTRPEDNQKTIEEHSP